MNTIQSNDILYMEQAIRLSQDSVACGGFPVGALMVLEGVIVGTGVSDGKQRHDPTSHAETDAIRNASTKLKRRNLTHATLYSSMEPCLMCFSACYWARIDKIVFAIRKQTLSPQHYDGLHDLETLNQKNNRSMEIIHSPSQEQSALRVVQTWEQSIHT